MSKKREGDRRHLEERTGVGRPDGRAHGQEVPVDELGRPPSLLEQVCQGELLVGLVGEELLGPPVEPADVDQHPEEGGPHQIAPLGEDTVDVAAPPLEAAHLVGDPEAHVAGLGDHSEAIEELDKARIVALVVDEEPGVDLVGLTVHLDVHGVGVSARPVVGLEDGHVVAAPEQVGADEASYSGTHDGDLHRSGLLPAVFVVDGPSSERALAPDASDRNAQVDQYI